MQEGKDKKFLIAKLQTLSELQGPIPWPEKKVGMKNNILVEP